MKTEVEISKGLSSLWVARNKDNSLYLFSVKPHKGYENIPVFKEIWCCGSITPFCYLERSLACVLKLNRDMFKEVTYENSPVELIINNK